MQPISSYRKREAYLRLALQGPPGVGKSTLACHFPGAYFIDLDLNLGGPLNYLQDHKQTLPVGYDTIARDEDGKAVPLDQQWARLNKCLQVAVNHPDVKTIVIDSATKLADIMVAETLRAQGKAAMSKQEWGFFFTLGKHFMGQMTSLPKHFVIIFHEKVEKDEIAQTLKYFLYFPGQLQHIMGALVSDVWRCEVTNSYGIPPTYKWNLRTMPDQYFQLKNSLQLPPVFEFKWEVIQAALDKFSDKDTPVAVNTAPAPVVEGHLNPSLVSGPITYVASTPKPYTGV